jgi:ADP-ribose pyrophosphatase YjhB (NUDIX family)
MTVYLYKYYKDMNMKKYAGIIVRCNNKVLLCKRNSDSSLPGYWSCPAGGVENNENPKDAAVREFFEETNLEVVKDIEYMATIKRYNRDGTKVKGLMYCYLIDVNDEIYPDLDNAEDGDEHTECGYFGKDEIPQPMTKQFNKLLNIILK